MPSNITTSNPKVREYITNNDAEGLARYFSSLPYNTSLRVTIQDDIGVERLHQLQIILQALKHNNTITNLDLTANNIGNAGAAFLANALETNTTITTIYLISNNIGNAGAAFLANALERHPTLNYLHLANNNIGDEGAAFLANSLTNNTNITAIYLIENDIGDQGMSALSQALQNNSTLRVLDLFDNNITLASEAAIIDLLKNSHISALAVDVDSIYQAIAPLLEENKSINAFIDSVKQHISFDGINMGYLLRYFDFSPASKEKINKKLLQEQVVDANGQEHSLASLISDSIKPIEFAVSAQLVDGIKESSLGDTIAKAPDLASEHIISHLTSKGVRALFCALHLNNQTNPQESNDDIAAPAPTEESSEVNTSGCLLDCCVIS